MSDGTSKSFVAAIKVKNFGVVTDWFAFVFFWTGMAALVASSLAAWSTLGREAALRVLAIGTAFAAACAISGWLLGLLFAIPRSLARPQPAPNAAGPVRGYRANTNLEDVSDWLTKTLIGLGLTQLTVIPGLVWRVAGKVNDHGLDWPKTGQILAISLLVYFTVGGFWLGYIATRTILTKLFDAIESIDDRTVEVALATGQLALELKANRVAPTKDVNVAAADRALLKLNIRELVSARELAAWGVAKARGGDLYSAAVALEQSLELEQSDAAAEALLTVYVASGRFREAAGFLQIARATEPGMVAALYAGTREGASKAIEIGENLVKTAPTLNVHVWLACAYGQRHKWAKEDNDEEGAGKARDAAVREIEAALKLDPSVKPWLASLWNPRSGAEDDDLRTLADDQQIARLLS